MALAILLCGLPAAPAVAQEAGLALGTSAPAVTVKDLDGMPVSLGQYIGKQPLFLEWWATWCEQCDALLPRVRRAHAELGDRGEYLRSVADRALRDVANAPDRPIPFPGEPLHNGYR